MHGICANTSSTSKLDRFMFCFNRHYIPMSYVIRARLKRVYFLTKHIPSIDCMHNASTELKCTPSTPSNNSTKQMENMSSFQQQSLQID